MRNRYNSLLLFVFSLFMAVSTQAQQTAEETGMRSNGKIYVVMAVCITILTGLIIYLISIDRKVSKLEKHDG